MCDVDGVFFYKIEFGFLKSIMMNTLPDDVISLILADAKKIHHLSVLTSIF